MANKNTPKIDLSISLVSYKNRQLLENCLNSIFANIKRLKFEVSLVDNASKDGTVKMVKKKFPKVKLIENSQNLIYSKAHNQNLKKVKGKYFLVLNEDTLLSPSTLGEMVKFLEKHPKVGLASCREIDEKGIVDMTCSRFPHPIYDFFEASFAGKFLLKLIPLQNVKRMLADYRYKNWKRNTIRAIEVIPGSFFMGRKEVLNEVGLFDENLLLFYEEPDLCQRALRAGWETFHNGKVTITHLKTKAIAKLPEFARYQIAEHDMLNYYKKYFGFFWWLFLWISFRPNWLYWKVHSLLQ